MKNKSFGIFLACAMLLTCGKKTCYNISEFNDYQREMLEWYPDTLTKNVLFSDSKGIKQTLGMVDNSVSNHINSDEDDCGNRISNFAFFSQYKTSISPYYFSLDIFGDASPGGFLLRFTAHNFISGDIFRTVEYDLKAKRSKNEGASAVELPVLKIENDQYTEVLEVTFKKVDNINEIEKVYLAKKYGIIKVVQKGGYTFFRISK